MSDYIERQAVIDAIHCDITITGRQNAELVASTIGAFVDRIKALPSADAIPYSIESDGTLTITVPKGTYKNINRVLVEEDGTHWGGLYYAD